jgi:hypothetical protein
MSASMLRNRWDDARDLAKSAALEDGDCLLATRTSSSPRAGQIHPALNTVHSNSISR